MFTGSSTLVPQQLLRFTPTSTFDSFRHRIAEPFDGFPLQAADQVVRLSEPSREIPPRFRGRREVVGGQNYLLDRVECGPGGVKTLLLLRGHRFPFALARAPKRVSLLSGVEFKTGVAQTACPRDRPPESATACRTPAEVVEYLLFARGPSQRVAETRFLAQKMRDLTSGVHAHAGRLAARVL
jgi:hypothetical protein